jgi:hypothetical protein
MEIDMAIENDPAGSQLKPYAVPVREAQRLLGNKSRGELYEEIGKGNLDAIKDDTKTLIVVESIDRYMKSLPPAKIRPPAPRLSRGTAS